ncbi:uridine kinase family protein [Nocardia aurea]|uniref:uridine kinase family protein n=1 Tax=Nocardia aurea TaxID=2144174 RepID=UPI0018E544C6|nr:hypothetical protein [Nocardia aurea]
MAASKVDISTIRSKITAARSEGSAVALVGIDGRGGSGKSTLARQLADGWSGVTVIEMDDFYLPRNQRPDDTSKPGANFDRYRLISEVLEPLRAGRHGKYQRYDWNRDELAEWHEVDPAGLVIVEGVYSTSSLLRDYFDFKAWVDASYEVRLARGVARDGEEMRSTWVDKWMPTEDVYVALEEPQRFADLIVDGSGVNGDANIFTLSD